MAWRKIWLTNEPSGMHFRSCCFVTRPLWRCENRFWSSEFNFKNKCVYFGGWGHPAKNSRFAVTTKIVFTQLDHRNQIGWVLLGKSFYPFRGIFLITDNNQWLHITDFHKPQFTFSICTALYFESDKLAQNPAKRAPKPFRARGVKRLIIFNEPIRGALLYGVPRTNVH